MIYFSEYDIDRLVEDDAPLGDLTSFSLGLDKYNGKITLKARHAMVISGTEEARRLYIKNGLEILEMVASGTLIQEGDTIISAQGNAASIHMVWRSGLIMIEFASGIATRTHKLVKAAKLVSPKITVAGTRKHPPYMKKIALKALMAGGGLPHRTGLSDTILIFREHHLFLGDITNLCDEIQKLKKLQKEKKIVAEAHTAEEAEILTDAGVNVIQVDKMPVSQFSECVSCCKSINPEVVMIAAGGINANNAEAYAEAGADVLVTSWIYFGKPADIKAVIEKM